MFLLSTFFLGEMGLAVSKKKKAAKTSYHHGDLRRALMDEGLRWISKEGTEQLNFRELARRVGVSHGAPYRHFASREDFFVELALEGATLFLSHLKEAYDSEPKSVLIKFQNMGLAYFRFAIDYPHHYRLVFHREVPADLSGPQVDKLSETMEASFMALVQIVQEMQHEGRIRDDDPMLISSFIWSQLHGIVSLILDGRFHSIPGRPESQPIDPEGLFRAMTPYVLSGVGTGLSS
jgi:AcrR family transcriptional regulator